MGRSRKEHELRDRIIRVATDCHEALRDGKAWEVWYEASERLWDLVRQLADGRVGGRQGKIWITERPAGRPPHPRREEIEAAIREGRLSAIEIAEAFGCHRNTVYYAAHQLREADKKSAALDLPCALDWAAEGIPIARIGQHQRSRHGSTLRDEEITEIMERERAKK